VYFFGSAGMDGDAGSWALFVLASCVAGLCAGMVGVGMVLIVPSAMAFLSMEPKLAVASAIPGYLLTSGVGIWSYHEAIIPSHSSFVTLVALGAVVGGFVAALTLRYMPMMELVVGIACFAILFGFRSIAQLAAMRWGDSAATAAAAAAAAADARTKEEESCQRCQMSLPMIYCATVDAADVSVSVDVHAMDVHAMDVDVNDVEGVGDGEQKEGPSQGGPQKEQLSAVDGTADSPTVVPLALGVVVGLGSALTGTSGPLLFLPLGLLVYPRMESRVAVGVAMALCPPMALAMTVGNVLYGQPIDLGFALIVGLATSTTVPVGASLAAYLRRTLEGDGGNRVVLAAISGVLVATGAWMLVAELA